LKKVVVERPGSYERLRIVEFETPAPDSDEVLIEVHGIGVNYADCIVRMGLYKSARDFVGWPITPGFEVSGVVLAVGRSVKSIAVGDEVLGLTRFDGYSSHLVVPEHQVFARPRAFSMEETAAFPAVFLTASFALLELGNPRPGQSMLVHSAAGGVGAALVQLGKIQGCHVVGVVGASHKVEYVKSLGADEVIDKSTQDLWMEASRSCPEGFSMIFDANGVETLRSSYEHLRAPGRLIVYGFHTMMPRKGGRPKWLRLIWGWLRTPRFNPLEMTSANKSVLAFNLSYLFEEEGLLREHMSKLLKWIEEGRIKPAVVTTFDLENVAQAHRALESGQTIGKLVLIPAREASGDR
jgi:synaptic vesicle membrane protein VAT-1